MHTNNTFRDSPSTALPTSLDLTALALVARSQRSTTNNVPLIVPSRGDLLATLNRNQFPQPLDGSLNLELDLVELN